MTAGAFERWAVREAAACTTVEALMESYAAVLVATGVPLCRMNVPIRTLHPQIRVSAYLWSRAEGRARSAQRRERLDDQWRAQVERSPFWNVYTLGERQVRRRLLDPDCPDDFTILPELRAEGVTDYLVLADAFGTEGVQAVTFATDAPEGFDAAAVDALEGSIAPFLLRLDLLYTREVARTVTSTYLGPRTGPRVLAGEIHRGAVTGIDAVVGFCDLRGFTARSAALPPLEVTEFLNAWFERVEEEAERHGGEILKLIGDAALVVWPVGEDVGAACRSALAMAEALDARLRAETDLRCGVALHRGEVAYGNIGGRERLDFTVIGAAVNLASRLEGLCGALGVPYVVSAEVAAHVDAPLCALGSHRLKGIPEAVEVYGPPPSTSSTV
jgi:adenylate cyclase